ncbi:MupA/Atu3671 family FMN-dependent luciferase-like monooxygenase [Gemmatimonas sp.]|uniref:MupA/Atu3671 family FMN-dependent luciferase-like monooxygenase n=1 Tax=Gemmatimonas sp. TaxID=1962908 RepID=UPI00391F3F77
MRALLIGSESLVIQCGEALRARHWHVSGVVSDAAAVRAWAGKIGLPVFAVADLETASETLAFDWLLSITHLQPIPERVLGRAACGAVNFHDGPLPRYGGLQAAAWALHNGERTHGVVWHRMTAVLDGGAVLVRRDFPIEETDTALTLNARCWAAALDAFAELVTRLEQGAADASPAEVPDPVTHHGRADRPQDLGRLRPEQSAGDWERALRAADTGAYPNPFVLPWVWLGAPVMVKAVQPVATEADSVPGQIVAVHGASLVLRVADRAVMLSDLHHLDGRAIRADAWCAEAGLAAGDLLPPVPALPATPAVFARSAMHEADWVRSWEAYQPVALSGGHGTQQATETAVLGLPAADEQLVAMVMLLLARGATSGSWLGYTSTTLAHDARAGIDLLAPTVPLEIGVDGTLSVSDALASLMARCARAERIGPHQRSIFARYPALGGSERSCDVVVQRLADGEWPTPPAGASLVVQVAADGSAARWASPTGYWSVDDLLQWHDRLVALAGQWRGDASAPVGELSILTERERNQINAWGRGPTDEAEPCTIADAIRQQVTQSPDRVALHFGDQSLTFAELQARADIVACHLQARGVRPDERVAVMAERSMDLVVALLGVLRAGAAYVPIDPHYPAERRRLMLEDCGARILLTQAELTLPGELSSLTRLHVEALGPLPGAVLRDDVRPEHLAYVIYTSGSTGRPKGVMVEHRQVSNFFAGMDRALRTAPGVWLAVTSVSFDISVLELFWTLSRGFTVVVAPDRPGAAAATPAIAGGLGFSLFYFSADEQGDGREKYRLLMDGARFADANGFEAVWTPERHFHAFGGLYPNPVVTSAAIAAITTQVGIRAGSCVLPLHHPARVAEDWAVVDNLSGGRVGVSIAPGWQPNDFVFRPEAYADAKQNMFRDIELVQRLWRGEAVTFPGPRGPVEVRTLPRPVQPRLPLWVTTAGNPETFAQAGRAGANLLTHLLGQSLEELAPKIAAYRAAWRAAGHAGVGRVTLMVHTFIGDDEEQVRETVRDSMIAYLRTSVNLIKQYAGVFPTLRQRPGSDGSDVDFAALNDEEMNALLEFSFERYFTTSALFGTAESAMAMVGRIRGCDVDEIACLVDFGLPTDLVLEHLRHLAALKTQAVRQFPGTTRQTAPESDLATLIARHGVTHFQCTPSMARLMLETPGHREALGRLEVLCVGGEALSPALARDLLAAGPRAVFNMYGPTETTVWSAVGQVTSNTGPVALGHPIANTLLRIVDPRTGHLLPRGVPGELWIGGSGVTRGYLDRPDLTTERFVSDADGTRWYRTGDLAEWRDGALYFLGRLDHQVKIRGYRIELGEIDSRLADDAAVQEVVVVAEQVAEGDPRLVAYLTRRELVPIDTGALRRRLLQVLPDFMVPTRFVVLRDMPRTPNLKIDRAALSSAPRADEGVTTARPAPAASCTPAARSLPPRAAAVAVSADTVRQLEQAIAGVWQDVLRLPVTGMHDNFFDLGGHSLLVVQVHQRLQAHLGQSFPVTDLFRFATVHTIAAHLAPLAAQTASRVPEAPAAEAADGTGDDSVEASARSAESRAARRLALAQTRLGRRGR